jgi:hypothetical protein
MANIASERLRSLRIEGRPARSATEAVRWLCASQAQDYAGAKWALGLRTRGAGDAAVEREIDAGTILRTHLLRPTWHFVLAEDIRWLLALTGPRVQAQNAGRYRELGLDGPTLSRATETLAGALEGKALTRTELREALAAGGVDADGQRLGYILMFAELEALVCSGPRRGKQHTYALLDERAPLARRLGREEALAELADRYFPSRGPATVHDFAKWSGLTVTDARAAVASIEPTLERREIDGVTYWSSGAAARHRSVAPVAHLLSIYDEYISSYRDRSAICAPAYGKRLVGMGAALGYVVVLDGQIVGTWRRTFTPREVELEVTPFRRFSAAEQEAVSAAAQRFAGFVGLELKA